MEKERHDMTPSGTWQDLMAYNGFKPYECPVCHKPFNSPGALEHHLANKEKLTLLEYQKSKPTGFACYSPKCTYCTSLPLFTRTQADMSGGFTKVIELLIQHHTRVKH
jgi:hypothetical protein